MEGWNVDANFNDRRIEMYGKSDPYFMWQRPVNSLQDIARLNIAFLHQRVARTPYYGAEFETNDRSSAFVQQLTEINKNLFVTLNGQPSEQRSGVSPDDGDLWAQRQRPYIIGFLDRSIAMRFFHKLSHEPEMKFVAYDFLSNIFLRNFREEKVVVTQIKSAATPKALKQTRWDDYSAVWNLPSNGWAALNHWIPYNKGLTAAILGETTCYVEIAQANWDMSNLQQIVIDALTFARAPGTQAMDLANLHRVRASKYTRGDYLRDRALGR